MVVMRMMLRVGVISCEMVMGMMLRMRMRDNTFHTFHFDDSWIEWDVGGDR